MNKLVTIIYLLLATTILLGGCLYLQYEWNSEWHSIALNLLASYVPPDGHWHSISTFIDKNASGLEGDITLEMWVQASSTPANIYLDGKKIINSDNR